MRPFALILAEELVEKGEGVELTEYICPAGYRTIGVGKRVDYLTQKQLAQCFMNGLNQLTISKNVAFEWLNQDLQAIYDSELKHQYFRDLDSVRQAVVIDIIYNLGESGWHKFKKTISYLAEKKWDLASEELLNSKYAKDVKTRAKRNAEMIKTGRAD